MNKSKTSGSSTSSRLDFRADESEVTKDGNHGNITGEHGGDGDNCGFGALLRDLQCSRKDASASDDSCESCEDSSEAEDILALPWVAAFVEKVHPFA